MSSRLRTPPTSKSSPAWTRSSAGPGMYTDTSRPNHLAQEVIDNSVDEALAGHAKTIDVTVHADGSVEVGDDGRGMPVDIHPKKAFPASS